MITAYHEFWVFTLGTPKSDYVICARPLKGKVMLLSIYSIFDFLFLFDREGSDLARLPGELEDAYTFKFDFSAGEEMGILRSILLSIEMVVK